MKKTLQKVILLFLGLVLVKSYSQEIPQPTININGVEPIVVEIPNKSKSEIYQSVKKWIQQSYNTPSEVLKADIKDEQLRIEGFNSNMYLGKGFTTLEFGVKYSLTIDIKDNKYRFSFYIIQDYTDTMDKVLYPFSYNFKKKDGSIKKGAEIKIETFNKSLSNLNTSIYNAIVGISKSQDDDW